MLLLWMLLLLLLLVLLVVLLLMLLMVTGAQTVGLSPVTVTPYTPTRPQTE